MEADDAKRAKAQREDAVWRAFFNAPAEEAHELLAIAQRMMTTRNLIKAPRIRRLKGGTDGTQAN